MATTKNLGQVAGVHIGSIPPENTILIWYDNTPSQNCHKVYDTAKKTWVILDQKIISYICEQCVKTDKIFFLKRQFVLAMVYDCKENVK